VANDAVEAAELVRDASEVERLRAQLRLSERQLEVSFDHAPIGMSLVDHEDRMVRVNAAMCRLLGRTEGELLTCSWKEMTHPDDLRIGAQEIQELFAGQRDSFAVEKRYLRGDGRVVWVQVNVALIRDDDGTPLFRLTQHVDLDDAKERERQLERVAEAERASAEELRRLDEIKNAFLDAVSHELRTPVTVVCGMAETLQRLRGALQPTERARLEDSLTEQSRRLARLLDDLLDVGRLHQGKGMLAAEHVDVVPLVREVIDASSGRSRTCLDAPPSLEVRTDPKRLTVIVDNLLNNADKYAPSSPVTVRLSARAPGGLCLEVIDHGPGIDADERERVFEPFYRGVLDHPQPGTGIGLSLVARFAALHGGDAWIEDTDWGTHVVVTLPKLPDEPAAAITAGR